MSTCAFVFRGWVLYLVTPLEPCEEGTVRAMASNIACTSDSTWFSALITVLAKVRVAHTRQPIANVLLFFSMACVGLLPSCSKIIR